MLLYMGGGGVYKVGRKNGGNLRENDRKEKRKCNVNRRNKCAQKWWEMI